MNNLSSTPSPFLTHVAHEKASVQDVYVFPASYSQRRLWFLDQLYPGSPAYNLHGVVCLTGSLDIAVLTRSFNEVIKRHEILRTVFDILDGDPVQVVLPSLDLKIPIIDLKDLPEAEHSERVVQLAREENQRPFDLARGPLLRVGLLHLSDQKYVLLLTIHHIIADAWSIGILLQELGTFYEAFSKGQPSPLSQLPIQYADFTLWQHTWLQGKGLETQLDFWKQHLANSPLLLELPTDRPRPAIQTSRGTTLSLVIPSELTTRLNRLSYQEEVTLFITLLTAFKTLLYRYTHQANILVGIPVANRNRTELEDLIGFFVNTLVLQTDLSGNPTFKELLAQVREITLQAYDHQDLPFDKLVEALQPERSLSYTPLFQVAFAFQNVPTFHAQLQNLIMEAQKIDSGTAMFDLTLSVQEEASGQLIASFEYNSDLFDATTISRMMGHFQTLLLGIVVDPEQKILTLPLLTKTEQYQLLTEWNDTPLESSPTACLHHLFEYQASQRPDAVAIIFEDKQLTYHQLNYRANQLAHYLRKAGVGPEIFVAIYLERSLELIIGILGVLKAGGAYLPLDLSHPAKRLAFMVKDTQVKVVLTEQQWVGKLPEDTPYICLDSDWEFISKESGANPTQSGTDDNLAYAIYTSGSTGIPKGVMVEHRSVRNTLLRITEIFGLTSADCGLHKSALTADGSVWEIFVPLLAGARLVLAKPGRHLDSTYLPELIYQQKITTVDFVPSTLGIFMRNENISEYTASLRHVWCGAEALPYDLKEHFLAKVKAKLCHDYGPTEASLSVTYWLCQQRENPHTVPIGRPIDNMQVYLLNSQLELAPIGVPGEVYVGGAGLARGYFRQPGLTAEKFVPHPFSNKSGARLYKTGDLARYLPDGNIEFVGRIDQQVKIRGFRVELGEIEAVVRQYPAVQETVVVVQEDPPGHKRLVAYIVSSPNSFPTTSDLRGFLLERLPEYMVPAIFERIEVLPLLPSGKIDRRQLPTPSQARPELAEAFVESRTPNQKILATVWAEVLGVEQVGIHDNFFELGGDSLLSIQAVAKANEKGLQLTIKQFFQHQTIAELAEVAGKASVLQVEQNLVTGVVPLTPIQCWFFEHNFVEPHHWNQSVLLEMSQPLDPVLVEQTVQHLLEHHDALRLRFKSENSIWQSISTLPEQAIPFVQINLAELPEVKQVSALEAAAAQLQARLNLGDGPLLQIALFDFGPHKSSRLLIIIHHLVIDLVSWQILLEDFQRVYHQLSWGEAVKLPAKTTPFKQWAERLVKYAQTEAVQQELHYWLALQTHRSSIPIDYPIGIGSNTLTSAQTLSMSLSVADTQALLHEVPKAYNTQINDVLLTALLKTFADWTGTPALLVDLESHGREPVFEDLDLSRTVGWFTTIFPVLLKLTQTSHPGDLLKSVKEQLRGVPNGGIGYGLLSYLNEKVEVVKQLRSLPRAEVSFEYLGQDRPLPDTSLFKLTKEFCGPSCSPQGERPHLLEIVASVAEGQLELNWTFSSQIHQPVTIRNLAQNFIEALHLLIIHCQSSEAGGYTPSDFTAVQLTQEALDNLVAVFGDFTEEIDE